MKRFLMGVVRLFWSWGFLKFLIVAFVLIILIYVEEDWRGAHELAEAKARWQAAGYSLNPADYYPPPVPDDQNLAALPEFQLEPNPAWHGQLWDKRLRDAMDEETHGGPLYDYDKKRELPELVDAAFKKMFPGKTPPASALARLEELYPLITELRTAAATRATFRLNEDYAFQPAWERPLGLVTSPIKIAKLLSYHARLSLLENQPQAAVDDIGIGLEIARGVGKDPTLVGGLVSLGDSAIARAIVDEGLTKHAWNDAQLAKIQEALKRMDYLWVYKFDMSNECVVYALSFTHALTEKPSLMLAVLGGMEAGDDGARIVALLTWRIWAGGWWDMNAAQMTDFYRRETDCVDLDKQLVDAKSNDQLRLGLEKSKELPGGAAPWNILYHVSVGPMTHTLEKFAQGQVQLDEDRIVCGIERYRIAHGTYPPTLDALVPEFIDGLPHDVMNGEPYHYRLNDDGTFLLYSVGWNQTDDGGKFGVSQYNPKVIDFDQGDWVWPMVKK